MENRCEAGGESGDIPLDTDPAGGPPNQVQGQGRTAGRRRQAARQGRFGLFWGFHRRYTLQFIHLWL